MQVSVTKKTKKTPASKSRYDREYHKRYKKIALMLDREQEEYLIKFLSSESKKTGISQQQLIKNLLLEYYENEENINCGDIK